MGDNIAEIALHMEPNNPNRMKNAAYKHVILKKEVQPEWDSIGFQKVEFSSSQTDQK